MVGFVLERNKQKRDADKIYPLKECIDPRKIFPEVTAFIQFVILCYVNWVQCFR